MHSLGLTSVVPGITAEKTQRSCTTIIIRVCSFYYKKQPLPLFGCMGGLLYCGFKCARYETVIVGSPANSMYLTYTHN